MLFYGDGDPWVYAITIFLVLLIGLGYKRIAIFLLYTMYAILLSFTLLAWLPWSILLHMLGAYKGYTWWEVFTKPLKGDPQ